MARYSRYEPVTLLASAARTATGTGDTVRLLEGQPPVQAVVLILDVTAAATAAGDTLDARVECLMPGSTWVDICAFTQVLGNGGAKRYVAKVIASAAEAEFDDAALGAGIVRDLLAQDMRVEWTIADAGADDASFTFSVTAIIM